MIFFIQCAPVFGDSGWTYIRFGGSGSAFPATTHSQLLNLYLRSWNVDGSEPHCFKKALTDDGQTEKRQLFY